MGEPIFLAGVALSLLFTELTQVSPGGIIVPGYFALMAGQPLVAAVSVAIGFAVLGLVKLLSAFLVLYGRRRFAICIALGLLLRLAVARLLPETASVGFESALGALIPGILAGDMDRQGPLRTLLGLTAVVSLLLLLSLAVGRL
jgi:gamma-polyglutamate biosynthesis protein CapC